MVKGKSVAEVLAFAHAGNNQSYDLIGERARTASPHGASPLHTLSAEREAARLRRDVKAEMLRTLRDRVKPLSFSEQMLDGKCSFEITAREICIGRKNAGTQMRRRFALAHPPQAILAAGTDRDAAPMVAHQLQLGQEADIWWIPFWEIVKAGRFVKMQEGSEQLTSSLDPHSFYLFVSHRWLTPSHPDPEGRQAALVAWQVLGHVLHAIWIAAARGRLTPRKSLPFSNAYVGIHGSELAESILVNMLRALPDAAYDALVVEAEQFDDIEDGLGLQQGLNDIGLAQFSQRLSASPRISEILSRFRVWYDYSCMPQEPRNVADDERFEILLERLGGIQVLGRTIVLLDDVEDYFGRAWCTYEACVAHELAGATLDILSGREVIVSELEAKRSAFHRVALDRPHLIWRAILDTEVFGIQSPDACMNRLGLETTRTQDRSVVYSLLLNLGPPRSIHYDEGEVVTGVLPLPIQHDQAIVVDESFQRLEASPPTRQSTFFVNDAASLLPLEIGGCPAFETLSSGASGGRKAHAAVLGSCEGEAVLYSHWVRQNVEQIGEAIGADVSSISWLASDVAPVGHFALGSLEIQGIKADVWVLIGSHAMLKGGYMPRIVLETLRSIQVEFAELEIDGSTNNLQLHSFHEEPRPVSDRPLNRIALTDPVLRTYEGGLFRTQVIECLQTGSS